MYQVPNVDSQFSLAAFVGGGGAVNGSNSNKQQQQQQQQSQRIVDDGVYEYSASAESVSFVFDEIDAVINSKDFQDLTQNNNNNNNNYNSNNNNKQQPQQQQQQQDFLYEQQVTQAQQQQQQQQQQNLDGRVPNESNNCLASNLAERFNFANQTNAADYKFASACQGIVGSDNKDDDEDDEGEDNDDDDDDLQLKESIYEEIRESLCVNNNNNNNNNNHDNYYYHHHFNAANMATSNASNNNTGQHGDKVGGNANLTSKNFLAAAFEQKSRPYVEIVEQPAKCSLRFRYKCEGRSAGSLPGVNSTLDRKTFPSIRIVNYVGRAVVVVSCVTREAPYRAHPHNIVGKEGCKKGICTIVVDNEPNTVRTFPSLGIQCVKRKDIEESLGLRESINVDPFRNGFAHKLSASTIDLNVVRLCFQVFIQGATPNKCDVPLTPVVSEPIHDKKAMSDLVITKLSHCSAPATGGREVILLCDRISKDDTQIRFYEERDGKLVWETYSELSPADVHKQVAICFKTPKYYNEHISQPVMVRLQLKRPSDNQVSEPRLFQFLPCESDEDIISRKRQKIEWVNMNHHALDSILQPAQAGRHLAYSPASADGPTNAAAASMQPVRPPHRPAHQAHELQANNCMIAHQQQQQQLQDHHAQQQQQQQQQRLSPELSRSPAPFGQQQQPIHLAAGPSRLGGGGLSRQVSPQPGSSPAFEQSQQQQQQLRQDGPFMADASQNLVVRREIIDDEGKVMRLVDRPAGTCQQAEAAGLAGAPSKPLASSLDRIDTAELMRDMTFNSGIDLNLGSSFSIHLQGPPEPSQQLQQQLDHQQLGLASQQAPNGGRQREVSCNGHGAATKNC